MEVQLKNNNCNVKMKIIFSVNKGNIQTTRKNYGLIIKYNI